MTRCHPRSVIPSEQGKEKEKEKMVFPEGLLHYYGSREVVLVEMRDLDLSDAPLRCYLRLLKALPGRICWV